MEFVVPPEEILSRLIRCNTTNPPGNELPAARILKELCAEVGIAAEVIEAAPGRANFIASIGPCSPGARSLLFLSHLDVVPPGDGWSFDPFGGEIRDGFVHGRGALDCKGLTAAQVAALLVLAAEQGSRPLKGRLTVAATADEEKGGRMGVRFLLEKMPEKLTADFAVNEGAEEPLRLGEETLYFVQVGEKGLARFNLRARGRAAHGSLPTLGENAILKMAEALTRLRSYCPEVILLPEVEHLLGEVAVRSGWEREVNAANLNSFLAFLGTRHRGFAAALHAMTRLTVSPNVIRGGTKTNVVPDLCEVEVDARLLPGQDAAFAAAELRCLLGPDVEVEITSHHPPRFSPAGGVYYEAVAEAIHAAVGREAPVTCLPAISAGATDSRFLRAAGVPCYGVAVYAPDFPSALLGTVHGPDERIDIKSLHTLTRFFYLLARRYLG